MADLLLFFSGRTSDSQLESNRIVVNDLHMRPHWQIACFSIHEGRIAPGGVVFCVPLLECAAGLAVFQVR